MLTRCPECNTTFRVTPEQLKARAGDVRCGACQNVFNALDTLVEEAGAIAFEPVAPAAASTVAKSGGVETASSPAITAAPAAESANPASPSSLASPSDSLPRPPRTEPQPVALTEASNASRPSAKPTTSDSTAAAAVASSPPATVATAATPALGTAGIAATVIDNDVLPPPPLPTLAAPTGMVTPTTPSLPARSPPVAATLPAALVASGEETASAGAVVWLWVTGCLLACIALCLQLAVALRTEIAVLYPSAKPALTELCAFIGCDLPFPRKAELVGIEASDLHPDPAGKGKLAMVATLKNRAPFVQEYPFLELTLTDTGDQPLVRRVIAPKEYLRARTLLANGFPAGAELAVNLAVDADGVAAAGYRLYLFYP